MLIEVESSEIWSLYSWKNKTIRQQPEFEDKKALSLVLKEIERAPRIVDVDHISSLKQQIKECGTGERMLIHLGDGAETFIDGNESSITNRYVLYSLCQMLMMRMLKKNVTKIGRIAGQYAKPRSSPTEVVNNERISSYFGDNINEFEPTLSGRKPNPKKLLNGYHWSITTHHTIKKLVEQEISALSRDIVEDHFREQTKIDKESLEYEEFINTLKDGMDSSSDIGDLYISHEGLLLDYESRLTRLCKAEKDDMEHHYDLSAHFLWIGERTNKLDEAHVEFFRGIKNPIGIKVGPKTDPDELVKGLKVLNPSNELGKVTAILRFGVANVEKGLVPILEAIKASDLNVVWVSDAVHGNTYVNDSNYKVRNVDTILEELTSVYKVLNDNKLIFGGIHLEASGHNVTECIGGITNTSDDDLFKNYETQGDPRLNFVQTLHVIYKFCKSILK